jgi:D-alanine-D-alanine ligase
MKKLAVGVVFGSRSVEHGVSILTAHYVMAALDRAQYDVVPIYITREGHWVTGDALRDPNSFRDLSLTGLSLERVIVAPDPSLPVLMRTPDARRLFRKTILGRIDVAFPVIHGTHGEDGTIQGLFELADVPYVGAGVLASAAGMDKILMKSVFRDHGLPVVRSLGLLRSSWRATPEEAVKRVEATLAYPLFVKPANAGSSIGITKARDREQLRAGLELASRYDRRIIVEESVENATEINCAVLGYEDPKPSLCEQAVSRAELFSYQEKYMRDLGGSDRLIPAPLSNELTAKIQNLAVQAFRALDCSGVARVDFLVAAGGERVYVNEINTLPGALAFRLWKPLGLRFPELLDRLIRLALERHEDKRQTCYTSEHDAMLLKYLDRIALSKKFGMDEW